MKLQIELTDGPGGTFLNVSGEVDMESSPRLRDKIQDAIKKKPAALKLELKNVPYIDSSGIAVLIEGMRWCNQKKIDYALVNISDSVRGVLQLSKLLPVFKVESL